VRPALPCCLLTATALLLSACGGSSHKAAATPATVQVSVTSCGVGWKPAAAGQQHIVLADTDSRPGEVRLVSPRTGAVFADVEPIGPATTANMDVNLAAGTYAFRCLMEDEAAVTGPSVTITGAAVDPAPGVIPVDQTDLIPATKAYQAYVSHALPGLARHVATLRHDIAAHDTATAKKDWLIAHQSYERLGAAYDAFGHLDGEINGLTSTSGFHGIESGLWHGQAVNQLSDEVDTLAANVDKLAGVFAKAQVDPLTISIRAHEISENALQFELTGRDDFGSHSELATVSANLDGTKTVLAIVAPLLASRTENLPVIDAQLAKAKALVDAQHHASGWTPLSGLTTREREDIDAAINQLCEDLAPVASILEPRRTS